MKELEFEGTGPAEVEGRGLSRRHRGLLGKLAWGARRGKEEGVCLGGVVFLALGHRLGEGRVRSAEGRV